jgi:hypothetical protein
MVNITHLSDVTLTSNGSKLFSISHYENETDL